MMSTPMERHVDELLEDVATKIQLTPTAYKQAVVHFDAVSGYLDEGAMPDLDPVIYPQGSFRTGTTISAHDDREEYDIDLLLELNIKADANPDVVLGYVAERLEAGKGRLKFMTCEIKKRCVTLGYADMHLDVTPAVLSANRQPRVVTIFDRHPGRPDHALANPEGFARWFDYQARPQVKVNMRDVRAQVVPVPQQEPPGRKPERILSVQLLKRFRDMRSSQRGYARCPSVLLSCLAAEAPAGTGLRADLRATALHVASRIGFNGLDVRNPACDEDRLTDRWPTAGENLEFAKDLQGLVLVLDEMVSLGVTQVRIKDILRGIFGENAAAEGFRRVQERAAEASRAGRFMVGASGVVGASAGAPARAAPPHRFYGA